MKNQIQKKQKHLRNQEIYQFNKSKKENVSIQKMGEDTKKKI